MVEYALLFSNEVWMEGVGNCIVNRLTATQMYVVWTVLRKQAAWMDSYQTLYEAVFEIFDLYQYCDLDTRLY